MIVERVVCWTKKDLSTSLFAALRVHYIFSPDPPKFDVRHVCTCTKKRLSFFPHIKFGQDFGIRPLHGTIPSTHFLSANLHAWPSIFSSARLLSRISEEQKSMFSSFWRLQPLVYDMSSQHPFWKHLLPRFALERSKPSHTRAFISTHAHSGPQARTRTHARTRGHVHGRADDMSTLCSAV